jgi:outer membrane lipoprotein carrier protein
MVVSTLNGNVFDEKTFDITFFKNKTHHIVKLNTKEKNIKKYIKTITLKFLIDEYDASEVLLMEPSDDYTKIVFKNRKKNAKMDQNIFNP